MLLVIDSGNTDTVFALYEGKQQKQKWRLPTHPSVAEETCFNWLLQCLAHSGKELSNVKDTVIASVVPDLLVELKSIFLTYLGKEPHILGEGVLINPIKIHLENPSHVGADRLANAVACQELYGGPAIIVDMGTATTFDLIDEEGAFHGGAIAPGVNSALESLTQKTAKLPDVSFDRTERVLGKTTVEAMEGGSYWGYIGLVEGLLKRLKQENHERGPFKIVMTGGFCTHFKNDLPDVNHTNPDLTLQGLQILAARAGLGMAQ